MRNFGCLIVLLAASSIANAQSACSARLLVSGYFSNNVHVYDACSGVFERVLDSTGRINGAQATRIGPDGKLYVISEGNGRVLRYDAATLAFDGDAVALPANFGGTGLAFRGDEIWVGGYNYDGVKRFSLAGGQPLGDAVAPRASGLNGADNGMVFGPDGRLYVPGYDSDNVVRMDPSNGTTSVFIAAGAGGLNETRGILFETGGQTVLVSSEGNGRVLRYNATNGAFIEQLIGGLSRPTGLAYHPDGSLLVAEATGVYKFDPQTGAPRGLLASADLGQASGVTYVSVVPVSSSVDLSQVGTQYFVTGNGPINGRSIEIGDMISTTGPAFGSAFNPAELQIKRWGSLRIEFTSCTQARLTWDSTGGNSAGFGSGSYALLRVVENDLTRRCLQQGFANASDLWWINGAWYGGADRNGEGLLIDQTGDGRAFVAWFTYRPR